MNLDVKGLEVPSLVMEGSNQLVSPLVRSNTMVAVPSMPKDNYMELEYQGQEAQQAGRACLVLLEALSCILC